MSRRLGLEKREGTLFFYQHDAAPQLKPLKLTRMRLYHKF